MASFSVIAATLLVTAGNVAATSDFGVQSVGKLPVLGFNTWNAFQCNIDQDIMLQQASLMKSLGLQAAGYNYINIDDCYAEKNRTASGDIQEDKIRFSRGMRNLTDTLHAQGFKAGIYGDAGWTTCGGYPGSYSHEEADAKTFREKWGFDYLKYDNCAIPFDNITQEGTYGRYKRMSDAIQNLAKRSHKLPMIFSLCDWGWQQVNLWGAEFGQSWRTTGDIAPNWDSLAHIININSFIASSTHFYGHNDLDMLQLGNGNMTYEESKSHFTVWALMKSPLFIGTNLSSITPEILGILKNKDILAINQDPVWGEGITPFRWGINPDWTFNATHPAEYWSGRSQNGTVVMMLNSQNVEAEMSFNLTESAWIRAGRQYKVYDLWAHTQTEIAVRSITKRVPPHGVVAMLLSDAGQEPAGLYPACSVWWQCTSITGERVGG